MKRAALYSRTTGSRRGTASAPAAAPDAPAAAPAPQAGRARWRRVARAAAKPVFFMAVGGIMLAFAWAVLQPSLRALTQADIDAAVLHTLETKTLPSKATRAAESVRQSVVRIQGFTDKEVEKPAKKGAGAKPAPDKKEKAGKGKPPAPDAGSGDKEDEEGEHGSVGSGVVIVDDGTILTNLHVIAGADRLKVTFFDGSQSDAQVVSVHPEKDLAVIRAKTIPDDLPSATLGSTQNLRQGDEVVAVGFPFGIGPSVSAGVVSGLNREFLSPRGKRVLSNLIQFDAAANPGNSGGPLVTMEGEVVGIVTAILNPTQAGTFVGIGFATTMESAGGAVGMPPF